MDLTLWNEPQFPHLCGADLSGRAPEAQPRRCYAQEWREFLCSDVGLYPESGGHFRRRSASLFCDHP